MAAPWAAQRQRCSVRADSRRAGRVVSLRDAIAREVDGDLIYLRGLHPDDALSVANAVLAMPEMEAIRTALRSLAAHRVQVVPEEAADWFAPLSTCRSR